MHNHLGPLLENALRWLSLVLERDQRYAVIALLAMLVVGTAAMRLADDVAAWRDDHREAADELALLALGLLVGAAALVRLRRP